MIDAPLGLSVVFNGCIYNYEQLRTELQAKGHTLLLPLRHRGDRQGVRRVGRPTASTTSSACSPSSSSSRPAAARFSARDRLGIKPLYLDETPRIGCASPRPCPRCSRAAASDTSIDRKALAALHDLPLRRARPADHPRRREEAPARDRAGDRARRNAVATTSTGSPSSPATTRARLDLERTGRTPSSTSLRTAVERRMVADVPVGVLLSGGIDSRLVVALLAEARPDRPHHLQHRLRLRGRRVGRRVRVLDARRRALRHRPPPDHDRQLAAAARHRRRRRGDERADGQPRLRRLLPAQRGRREVRQGRPVRARAPTRCSAATTGTRRSPAVARDDAVEAYSRVFFDRRWSPSCAASSPPTGSSPDDAPTAFIARALRRAPEPTTAVDAALRNDTTIMLVDDPVKRVDNMTMAWGLEARVPFLDHEFVELAGRIPPELKLSDGGKGVLKRASRGHRPRRGDRPDEGLLPGARHPSARGPVPRAGARRADRSRPRSRAASSSRPPSRRCWR